MERDYPAIVHRNQDGSWWAELVDFPEATTHGGPDDDVRTLLNDLVASAIAARRHDGLEVPGPSEVTVATAQAA